MAEVKKQNKTFIHFEFSTFADKIFLDISKLEQKQKMSAENEQKFEQKRKNNKSTSTLAHPGILLQLI